MMWLKEGGPSMFVLLAVAVVAVGAAFAHLAEKRRVTLYVGGAAVLLALLVGVTGWMHGMETIEAALVNVDPAMHAQLRAVGEREARHPLELGGAVALVAGVILAAGELRRRD